MRLGRQISFTKPLIKISRDDNGSPSIIVRDKPKRISQRAESRDGRWEEKEIIIGFERGEQEIHKQVQLSDGKELSVPKIDKLADSRRRRRLKIPSSSNQSKRLIKIKIN
jgi:hypothetical protein